MQHEEFELLPDDVPAPGVPDEELATRNWPMPPVRAWSPAPPRDAVIDRILERTAAWWKGGL